MRSGNATISFILNQDTTATKLEIVSRYSGTVVRSVDLGPLTAGAQSFTWDGRNDSNAIVPTGVYFGRVTATSTGLSDTDWTQLPTVLANFFSPRGVSVNRLVSKTLL